MSVAAPPHGRTQPSQGVLDAPDRRAPSGGPLPVLFVHYGDEALLGSETMLLALLGALDRDRVRPAVWCNGAALAEACREAGFETHRSPFAHYFDFTSPRFDPRRYAALVAEGLSLARRHGARVLHANSAAPVQWLAPVSRLARRPLLAHLHAPYHRRSRYALLLHLPDLAVGVSHATVAGLLEDGMPHARVRIVPNGLDLARLSAGAGEARRRGAALRAKVGVPRDAPVVATLGSLIPRKGHDVLLRAFASLPRKAPDTGVPYLLAGGDGPERAALEALARELGVADRVRFLGNTTDLPAFYGAADMFALATRQEAFGLVLAEAGHFGLPVVATRVGGVPEVVTHGETGVLVPPEDPLALAAALGGLLADPAARKRLGEAGRHHVAERFTARRMAADFEGAYEQLAFGAPPSSAQDGIAGPLSALGRLTPYARLLGLGRRGGHRPGGTAGGPASPA